MNRWTLVIGPVLLLLGCASGPRRVSEGWLQKRHHQHGWHVDLGVRKDHAERRTSGVRRMALRGTDLGQCVRTDERRPLSATVAPKPMVVMPAAPARIPVFRVEEPLWAAVAPYRTEDPEDLMPKKRWNRLAVPAFVVALGAVALALFSTSTIAVIAALVVTFVLAGISIRQIRWREEAGKGFAVAALMIAVLAAIVTAIVTATVGFV